MLSKLLQGHVSRVRALDCHRDRVLSGSDDRTVKLWSLNSGTKIKYILRHKRFNKGINKGECKEKLPHGFSYF